MRFGSIFFAAACIAACGADDWMPKGEVALVRLYASEDSTYGGACLVFRIKNTGRSSIEKATAAMKLETDKDIYFMNLEYGTPIPAGASAYAELQLDYRHAAESGSPEGLVIESVYFD